MVTRNSLKKWWKALSKDEDDEIFESIGEFLIEEISSLGKNLAKSFLGIHEENIPENLIRDLVNNTSKLFTDFFKALKE